MTSTLLLKLSGPLQSWGTDSRYSTRDTSPHPSKSGVVGLIAAAMGRRRSEPVEDLASLRFGVRVDQPGSMAKDFQTAIDWRTGKSQPLISRYYLADAVFIAAIEGPDPIIAGIESALKSPRFPLYLGRRSCPAGADLVLGIREGSLESALLHEPWHASRAHRKTRAQQVNLAVIRDAHPGETGLQVRDRPVSFAQEHRQYSWREVVQDTPVTVENPDGRPLSDDFFEAVMSA